MRCRIPRRCAPARDAGLIVPVLVGPQEKIRSVAAAEGFTLDGATIVDAAHSHEAAALAVRMAREGQVLALMKGSLHTDELMSEVVKRDGGLRTNRRIGHVFLMDLPTYSSRLLITDAAINIEPTLEEKADIVQNAIDMAIMLGTEKPKVAILAAVETVHPKMRSTTDAAALCKMADRGRSEAGFSTVRSRSTTRYRLPRHAPKASGRKSPAAPRSCSCLTSSPAT